MKKSLFTLFACLVFFWAMSNALYASGPKKEEESLPDEAAINYSPQTYETLCIVDEEGYIVATIPFSEEMDASMVIEYCLINGYIVYWI